MKLINDFHCSIIVRTNRSLLDITKELKAKPTQFNRKGEKLSKYIDPLETNVWIFEHIYRDYSSINDALESFFSEYSNLCETIKTSIYKDEMCIRLYVQSDYAQIVYVISTETLRKVSSLGISVEFSVFSWGKA